MHYLKCGVNSSLLA